MSRHFPVLLAGIRKRFRHQEDSVCVVHSPNGSTPLYSPLIFGGGGCGWKFNWPDKDGFCRVFAERNRRAGGTLSASIDPGGSESQSEKNKCQDVCFDACRKANL